MAELRLLSGIGILCAAGLFGCATKNVVSPEASLSVSSTSCPAWETDFTTFKTELLKYRANIKKELEVRSHSVCSGTVRSSHVSKKVLGKDFYIRSISVPSSEELSKVLPEFKYVVVPPKGPRSEKRIRTLFSFAGGPKSISGGIEESQMDSYQLIVADYVGLGLNEIHPTRSGVDDQFMNLEIYSRLIELIVRQEVDAGNVSDFVVEGGSYGSVGATAVAAHLSKLENSLYRPKLAFLNKVVTFKDLQASSTSKPKGSPAKVTQDHQIEWVPKRMVEKICVLPKGPECFDDVVLAKLTKNRRRDTVSVLEDLYKGFSIETKEPLPWFFRDAFHWEVAQQTAKAATFLNDVIIPGGSLDYGKLRCWFEKDFDNLPWNNRYQSASATASIEAHVCQVFQGSSGSNCGCFLRQTPYTSSNFQISPSVPILYVNGTEDSQTSIGGALAHYESQSNPNKRFIRLCGVGHEIFIKKGQPRLPGQIDREALLNDFFKSGLTGIRVGRDHLCI